VIGGTGWVGASRGVKAVPSSQGPETLVIVEVSPVPAPVPGTAQVVPSGPDGAQPMGPGKDLVGELRREWRNLQ